MTEKNGMNINTKGVVNELLINNQTINSPGNSETVEISGAEHVDVLIVVGTATGTPSITFHLNVVEQTSGQTIRSYDGSNLTASGTDYITVDGLTLGDRVQVSWDGTLDGSNYFSGVYVRLIAK